MKKKLSLMLTWPALALLALSLAACGGGGGGGAQEDGTPAYNPNVIPLSDAEEAPYLQLTNAQGITPCGVFNLGGFGEKIVTLNEYETCTPSNPSAHTIECLNSSGQWEPYTEPLTPSSNGNQGLIQFTSTREGICGVFPIPESALPADPAAPAP